MTSIKDKSLIDALFIHFVSKIIDGYISDCLHNEVNQLKNRLHSDIEQLKVDMQEEFFDWLENNY